jgi:hypothetical protein
MMDYQYNACERIDTHEHMPRRVWIPVIMERHGCETEDELWGIFKYAPILPTNKLVGISVWCDWYRGVYG